MPKGYPRKNCRDCQRDVEECGNLSASYLCFDCATRRFNANLEQLTSHEGPFFERWRRRHAASVGGIIVDDLVDLERTG